MQSSSIAGAIILGVLGVILGITVLPALVSAFFDTLTRIAAMYPGPTFIVLGGLGIYCLWSLLKR